MKYPISLIAALALVPLAQAQSKWTPPTPEQIAQHQIARYTTLLSLTSAQVETATAAFSAAASTEQTLRGNEKTAHQALEAAVKSNDTASIQQAAPTLGQIEGQLASARALADAKFYATLNADQKTKYAELEHGFHGGRGPGQPPSPPAE
jgi:NADPH-dependent curcumin reductase CurA